MELPNLAECLQSSQNGPYHLRIFFLSKSFGRESLRQLTYTVKLRGFEATLSIWSYLINFHECSIYVWRPTAVCQTDFGPTDYLICFFQNQRKVSHFQSFRPSVIIPSFFLHQIITMFTSRMTKILRKVEARWKRGWNNTKFYSHPLSPISFSCFLFDF